MPWPQAGSRLYVHKSQYDRVVEGITERARAIKVGYGMDPTPTWAP